MTDRRWLLGCGIAGALLAVVLSWDFFALSLDPWPDQAWILLAAERHHRGLGLTTTMDSSSNDLAVTDYHRLVYFPPGYPLLVSPLGSSSGVACPRLRGHGIGPATDARAGPGGHGHEDVAMPPKCFHGFLL